MSHRSPTRFTVLAAAAALPLLLVTSPAGAAPAEDARISVIPATVTAGQSVEIDATCPDHSSDFLAQVHSSAIPGLNVLLQHAANGPFDQVSTTTTVPANLKPGTYEVKVLCTTEGGDGRIAMTRLAVTAR